MTPTPDALAMTVAAAHRANKAVVHGDLWLQSLDVVWSFLPDSPSPFVVTVEPTLHQMVVRV